MAINEKEEIIFSRYMPNSGNPVPLVGTFSRTFTRSFLRFKSFPPPQQATAGDHQERLLPGSGRSGDHRPLYCGEKFEPQVDFIIDIGGQDIKCFKIKNGAIDNIFLNEACPQAAVLSCRPLQALWAMK